MKKPYVGVSGVVSCEQADTIYSHAEKAGLFDHRRILLGVKAVHETQYLDIPNKYGEEWYPVGGDISDVVLGRPEDNEFWVTQVFMDLDAGKNIADYDRRFVKKLLSRTHHWIQGIQFDMLPWDNSVEHYKRLFDCIKSEQEGAEVLVQCHGSMIAERTPSEIGRILDQYQDRVDHVLFDASHGKGVEMNRESLSPYIEVASERDWLGVGVAGGLNAKGVEQHIVPLLEDFPDLSFDAEGQLHVNEGESKALNMKETIAYVRVAADAVKRAKQ